MGDYISMFKIVAILIVASVILGILLLAVHMVLKLAFKGKISKNVYKQLIMAGLTFLGVISVILVLPITDTLRGQILSLIGIIISATLALSSTTLMGNVLAGVMVRSINSFRIGDFVEVDDNFGRVSEKGLLHVEVQTEDRNLVTIPNMLLVTKSVKVFHSTGTIVMAEVSLGYDVPRTDVNNLLIEAAEKAELKDPFVYILKLGDFSILYRVSGLLQEVKQVISAKSRLNSEILDSLHGADVEIVSPNFMNTRSIVGKKFVPVKKKNEENPQQEVKPEETVFDKADKAEKIEELKLKLSDTQEKVKKIKETLKNTATEEDRLSAEEDAQQLEIYENSLRLKLDKMEEDIQTENKPDIKG